MTSTLYAPAAAALPGRLAAALSGAPLDVPPFTVGVTNATPAYAALGGGEEVRERERER